MKSPFLSSKLLALGAVVHMVIVIGSNAQARAGGVSDGGGNAMVCFDNVAAADSVRKNKVLFNERLSEVTSIETYDLFEARQPQTANGNPTPVMPLRNSEKYEDYTAAVAERFKKTFPTASQFVNEGAKKIKKVIWTGALKDKDDMNHDLESGSERCAIVTMARQDADNEGGVTLRIDKRLFDHPKHTALSRSVLYLHEAIYAKGIALGHTTSKRTRRILGLMIRAAGVSSKELIMGLQEFGYIASRYEATWDGEQYVSDAYTANAARRKYLPIYAEMEKTVFKPLLKKAQQIYRAQDGKLKGKPNFSAIHQLYLQSFEDPERDARDAERRANRPISPWSLMGGFSSAYTSDADYYRRRRESSVTYHLKEMLQLNQGLATLYRVFLESRVEYTPQAAVKARVEAAIKGLKKYEAQIAELMEPVLLAHIDAVIVPQINATSHPHATKMSMIAGARAFAKGMAKRWPTKTALSEGTGSVLIIQPEARLFMMTNFFGEEYHRKEYADTPWVDAATWVDFEVPLP